MSDGTPTPTPVASVVPMPPPPTITERLTGAAGDNPLEAGGVRAAVVALVNIALGLLVLNVSFSDQEIVLLLAAVNPALLLVFAAFDKWVR